MLNTHFRCPKCRLWAKGHPGQTVTCSKCGETWTGTTLAEDGGKVAALECVGRIEGILLPGEQQAAFDEFQTIITHAIDAVLILYRRELAEPSSN